MSTMDGGHRNRDVLPPISHLDLEKFKVHMHDNHRYQAVNQGYSPAPLGSPTNIYPGPPPPYSSTASLGGYISPPESTTRRSTRDEQTSPSFRKSLPSIHEALSEKGVALGGPPAVTSSPYGSAPPSAITQSFPDGPKGPSNPFSIAALSEPSAPAPTTNPFSTSIPPPPPPPPVPQQFALSPRSTAPSTSLCQTALTNSTVQGHVVEVPLPLPARSPPRAFEPVRPTQTYPQYTPQPPPAPRPSEMFQFTAGPKHEESRSSFSAPSSDLPYSETVKRHLEMFDADVVLHEIHDASVQTVEFSRVWAQRHQQNNMSSYLGETLPSVNELDDMLRQAHRVMENLSRMREMVIAQQAALSEQRARLARGIHSEDDYPGTSEDYRNGNFGSGESKKRRGKAAPPGRCHSCNRAETPEWRRGPDGARTLCNACGLHYAKLTRKMGTNKAAGLTGSNLRPKPLDPRS